MENAIKEYKPLALVFYTNWDWESNIATIFDSDYEDFKNELENSKFITIWWRTINCYNVKEIRRDSELTEIQKIYYSQSTWCRRYIDRRIDWMHSGWTLSEFNKAVGDEKTIERLLQFIKDFNNLQENGEV